MTEPAAQPRLRLDSVTRRFGGLVAVSDVSFEIRPGDVKGLIGPNGAGKSTTFDLITGVRPPTSGDIWFRGERVTSQPAHTRSPKGMARTFQIVRLFRGLSVLENVGLPFTIAGQDPRTGDLAQRVREAIALVELGGKERHKPEQLSAGEQQRVAVARAIVTRPALLFADEPTGNLDFRTGKDILDALWRTCVERGQTIVLVTHDAKAAAYADRVFVIGDGTIQDEIVLGRRDDHAAAPLITRLAQLGL